MKRYSGAPGLVVLLVLVVVVFIPIVAGAGETQRVEQDETAAATISVWHGLIQDFGARGNPQKWVNILGNVQGVKRLDYSLNGRPFVEVAWGGSSRSSAPALDEAVWHPGGIGRTLAPQAGPVPEGAIPDELLVTSSHRLVYPGDFNIEIDTADLVPGANTVVIRANGGETTKTVTVNYSPGNTWQLPYVTDWSLVNELTDVAQVVDGKWLLQEDGIRPAELGYDRVVAIGDLAWDDYDVLVPITIRRFLDAGGGGVGIAARWLGHFQEADEQPGKGWWNMGAYGLYHNKVDNGDDKSSLRLYTGHYDVLTDDSGLKLETGVPYYFRMRVLSKGAPDGGFYSFRVWEKGKQEPEDWAFAVQDSKPAGWQPGDPKEAPSTGSVLLVAHEVDATFGDVVIRPVLDLSVSSIGDGSVSVSPTLEGESDAYLYGDQITLQATAGPGLAFAGWSGGMTGWQNPATLTLVADTQVVASFGVPRNLRVSVEGGGQVTRIPEQQQYGDGAVVLLRPQPDAGWVFTGWAGPNSEDLVDTGEGTWSVEMRGDKTVTAQFVRGQVLLPLIKRSR